MLQGNQIFAGLEGVERFGNEEVVQRQFLAAIVEAVMSLRPS